MAAGLLCFAGCAKKQAAEDDTYVMVDIGYFNEENYGDDTTFVAITGGFSTPEPAVTPVPTPEPTAKPRSTKKPSSTAKADKKEETKKEEKKTEEEKAEATPTPEPKKKTPYYSSYTRQSLSYESGSSTVSFETTTFDGSSASESIFSKSSVTMINIWTTT